MNRSAHAYLVECYAPGIDALAVERAGARARAACERMIHGGAIVAYLGAVLVAEDEVVFHAFRGQTAGDVAAASTAAGLAYERIVESVAVAVGPDGPDPAAILAGLRRTRRTNQA